MFWDGTQQLLELIYIPWLRNQPDNLEFRTRCRQQRSLVSYKKESPSKIKKDNRENISFPAIAGGKSQDEG